MTESSRSPCAHAPAVGLRAPRLYQDYPFISIFDNTAIFGYKLPVDPIKNPYAPGAGSRPPALTGREKEIESFRILAERLIEGRSAKSILVTVTGLRGVGKTVLLNTFRDIAEARGFKTGNTEVTHDVDFKSTRRLVRRALLAMSPIENRRRDRRLHRPLRARCDQARRDGAETGLDRKGASVGLARHDFLARRRRENLRLLSRLETLSVSPGKSAEVFDAAETDEQIPN